MYRLAVSLPGRIIGKRESLKRADDNIPFQTANHWHWQLYSWWWNPSHKKIRYSLSCHICPTKYKRSICISDFIQTTFFYLERFMKELADEQCSWITKGTIMYIQPFTTVVDWPDIVCLEKYLLCFIFADTAFLLGTTELEVRKGTNMVGLMTNKLILNDVT